MVVPKRGKVVISHDAFRVDEEKAATPDPLMGIFPLGCGFDDETEQATLAYYLKIAKRYIGSPMLSALYGVWAARSGNRRLSLEMLERGYGDFCTGRFMQTLEYRKDVFPEQPPAGPFFANLGGFLLGLDSWVFQRYSLGRTILKTGAKDRDLACGMAFDRN